MASPKPLKPTSAASVNDYGAPQPVVLVVAGYDATKTQTLKHVNGVFTWVTDVP